ncbi:hypothetical protein BO86DRAFT_211934 [Aspergillus japonicus CBS 114.51]|uniref:Uncharacterized protein n=1 Tax=Aspergillus japonicus CBS 114.51 TaxID=1448312 RepID=A0A8T8XCB0_ASPJA|nr:hypothetical protein BO86DRAFT_211934 [Aspergillus japonicus CBS 114.51]RAH85052.1 hypothetical protein BO86DRAFT_211934 [Aspergillus japonicus CBS 114.51]
MTIAVSRPTIRGSQFETDSGPRHKLNEAEPLRKAMVSFLRTRPRQSGGELGRGIGYVGQSSHHHPLPYGFFFTQPRREGLDELCSPLLPTIITRTTDDGNLSHDFGTSHQPFNPSDDFEPKKASGDERQILEIPPKT